jgi:hypothetical protein
MGLLNDFFGSPDQTQALGLLGASMMKGRTADGLLAANQFMAGAGERQMAKRLQEMQLQEHQMRIEDAQRQRAMQEQLQQAARSSFITPDKAQSLSMGPMPDGSEPPMVAPGFNAKAYGEQLMGIDPMKGMQFAQMMQKDETPLTVAPGASLVDRRTMKPVFTAPKETSLPAAIQEYQFAQQQGYKGTFEQWDTARKKAGASNTSIRVDNKMGESIAGQVGPILKDSYVAANGAAQLVDAAERIVAAVDSNKLIAGPWASQRLGVRQVAELLGIGGKDNAEVIANTRNAIRGLAEMTLEGRKTMRGEGAITESEGALAEKARSGRIEDLTPAEIRIIANASARAGRFTYAQHEEMRNRVANNPGTAGLAPFYKPLPLPQQRTSPKLPQAAPKATDPGPGVRFLGFEN